MYLFPCRSHLTSALPLHNTCNLKSKLCGHTTETDIRCCGGDEHRLSASVQQTIRVAALLVAVFTILVGFVGIVSPDTLTAVRRQHFATPVGLYAAGALRVCMGLVVILVAPTSRAPKTLRTLGTLMCLQGLAATVLGVERARAIMEWETMRGTALLRVGATVALAAGCFMAFAVIGKRPKTS